MDYLGKVTFDGQQLHRFEPVSCKHVFMSNFMEFDMDGNKVERATKTAPEWWKNWNHDNEAEAFFEKMIDFLKIMHSHLNISWGYIGGCEPNGSKDDRQWYVWCENMSITMWFENYNGHAQRHTKFFLGSTREYKERFHEQIKSGRFFQWLEYMEVRHQIQNGG